MNMLSDCSVLTEIKERLFYICSHSGHYQENTASKASKVQFFLPYEYHTSNKTISMTYMYNFLAQLIITLCCYRELCNIYVEIQVEIHNKNSAPILYTYSLISQH